MASAALHCRYRAGELPYRCCGYGHQPERLASILLSRRLSDEIALSVPTIARCCIGGFLMAVILHDLLLFSCLAAFVTGIVIAAASLL